MPPSGYSITLCVFVGLQQEVKLCKNVLDVLPAFIFQKSHTYHKASGLCVCVGCGFVTR